MVIALDSRSTDPRFSCYPLCCRVQPWSSYSPECACHPRLALFSLGNGVSREVNRHTMRHTVVQQLCLVSIWGLVNFISAPPYKPLSRKGLFRSSFPVIYACMCSVKTSNKCICNIVCVCSQACQLLTDIVYFVAYQENTGGDPFEVCLTHPDRERQKLLREQNVLKEVFICSAYHCRVARRPESVALLFTRACAVL